MGRKTFFKNVFLSLTYFAILFLILLAFISNATAQNNYGFQYLCYPNYYIPFHNPYLSQYEALPYLVTPYSPFASSAYLPYYVTPYSPFASSAVPPNTVFTEPAYVIGLITMHPTICPPTSFVCTYNRCILPNNQDRWSRSIPPSSPPAY